MGVSEMTRFGFGEAEFTKLAGLMADVILRGQDVTDEVRKLRKDFTSLRYCFSDDETEKALDALCRTEGL